MFVAPHLSDVVVRPSRVSGVLIAEPAAEGITENQYSVVHSFQGTEQAGLIIVELCNSGLLQHVLRYSWVVCV
jgi:hypothetical protein